ncbi:class I SAM-dependent methyltransferase [Candidatus Woesearchaeota archaeon]|nr:class I SAM-dependent methyltransferase [Candidatus Woesearchaeota archaeon]
METKKIIDTCPEYENKNPIIRKLFWNRINYAVELSKLEENAQKNLKILDVGCGRAKLFERINKKRNKFSFNGIDMNEDISKLKIKNAKFKVIKPESSKYPFSKNTFDAAFALDCFEHIKDLRKEIKKMKDVLKPEGIFIISGPTETVFYRLSRLIMKGTWLEVYEGEIHHHTIYQIRDALKDEGFKLLERKTLPFKLLPFFEIYSFRLGGKNE